MGGGGARHDDARLPQTAARRPGLAREEPLWRRGRRADGAFRPATGRGYVEAKEGAYERPMSMGIPVLTLLFETDQPLPQIFQDAFCHGGHSQ